MQIIALGIWILIGATLGGFTGIVITIVLYFIITPILAELLGRYK
jgi:multisubunit Na+/H+ antiporter MnhG subunit